MPTVEVEYLSKDEMERLANRLDAGANVGALSLEGVDGLFCALIASPRSVLPSGYLSLIFGDVAELGPFTDVQDANITMSLLMRYWNSVVADLEREQTRMPFVFEVEDGEVPGREWAQGFMSGTRLARDGWKERFDDEKQGDLFMIPLVAGEVDAEWPKEPVTEEFSHRVLRSMALGFSHSYAFFTAARRANAEAYAGSVENESDLDDEEFDSEPYVRPEPKVGRNEPCRCGSGKKYKKCCGSADKSIN